MTPAERIAMLRARVEWADEHELPVPFSAADARALLAVAEAAVTFQQISEEWLTRRNPPGGVYVAMDEARTALFSAIAQLGKGE